MHSHDEDFEKPHIVHIYNYFFVLAALIILTGVTAWVAFFDFGRLNTVVAVGIAIFKTFLVCWIFMHLKWSPKLIWLIAGTGGIFVIIMAMFTLADFDAQARRPAPKSWIADTTHYPDSTAPYRHISTSIGAHGKHLPDIDAEEKEAAAGQAPADTHVPPPGHAPK